MALVLSQIGSEIATEKLVIQAVSDDGSVTSVRMNIFINDVAQTHVLEHLPIFGTTNTFEFEINSIVKDYFASEFLPLTGANQTPIENAIVSVIFNEVIGTSIQGINYFHEVIVKNITQDAFQIEEFDLADYDCGDNGDFNSKLLTSSPNPLSIGDLTSLHLSCLTTSYTGTTPKQEWVVETYLAGVLVTTTLEDVDVPLRGLVPQIPPDKFDIATYRFDFDSSTGIDEVRIYIRDIASPFTLRSETRVYKLNDSCEKDITLSWLNEFGTQDSFTFLGNINRVGKYTDSTFKRTRPVNPVSTDVGDLVYKSSFNYEYDLFSDRMPEKDVQWLSNILINKRAAIQESPTYTENGAFLYNFFALNNGISGDGTVSGGIVNPTQTGWALPSQADFATLVAFLGGDAVAGGKMKEKGTTNWATPNTGADNSSQFTALPQGIRNDVTGVFGGSTFIWQVWTYDTGGGGENGRGLNTGTSSISFLIADNKFGHSVRLVRAAVGGEVDGQIIKGAYRGNNNKLYDGVVIGTQVWIERDLQETMYNDATGIVNETVDGNWGALSTGAYCLYNNVLTVGKKGEKYFPIVITTDETVLEDKFTPETIFRLKFRLANRRKGLK
jgi:uncharacterized protein (TIGR02145 family)